MITNPITIFCFLMRRASTAAIQDRCARKMFRRYFRCSFLRLLQWITEGTPRPGDHDTRGDIRSKRRFCRCKSECRQVALTREESSFHLRSMKSGMAASGGTFHFKHPVLRDLHVVSTAPGSQYWVCERR